MGWSAREQSIWHPERKNTIDSINVSGLLIMCKRIVEIISEHYFLHTVHSQLEYILG
jgi:hypothetical protein